jgi:hypothetical protein
MDGVGGAREPIEIELVSNDDEGSRRVERAHEAVEPPAGSVPPQPGGLLDTEHGRLTVVALVVAIVALPLGWVLGRSGGSNEPAIDVTPTLATRSSDPARASDTLPRVSGGTEVESSATTPATIALPSSSAPTAVASEITTREIAVDPLVAGSPIEIVATGAGRSVFIFDLQVGTVTERVVDRQPFGRPTVFTGQGWTLLPSWDDELESTLIRDGADPEPVDVGQAGQLLGLAGTDTFWRIVDESIGGGTVVEQVRFDGAPTGVSFDLPARPRLADPAGGVLVEAASGLYRVGSDGVAKLTDGELLGIAEQWAVASECDDQLVCDYVVIDRATGGRTALPLDPALGPDPELLRPWWPVTSSVMSPDGMSVIVPWLDVGGGFRETLGVIELATGEFTALDAELHPLTFAWSPDGRLLLYLDGGRLFAFDRTSGQTVRVAPDAEAVEALAIRAIDVVQ